MGLLSNLFGGGPEKHEEKGDELRLDLQYREASYFYQKAIDALKDAADPRAERLRGKLREARRQACREMMDEAEELERQGARNLAREKLETAVTWADDPQLAQEVERRLGEMDARLSTDQDPAPEELDIVAGTGEEELYELALAGLAPADQERARALGDPFRLAYESCQNERWEECLERLAPLVASHPGEAIVLEMNALACERLGDWAAAHEAYRSAHAADPARPAGVLGLAAALTRLGRNDEARQVLVEAVASHPVVSDLSEEWVEVHIECAMALSAAEQYAEAMRVVTALFQAREANQASLCYNMAGLLERTGREPEARAALEKAIHLAPRASVYRERLADFLLRRGEDLDAALALLVEANEVETVGPAGMLGGGSGKVLISPNRGRYLYKMARIYFLKGEDLEAERTITTALHVTKDPEVLRALEELRRELHESRPTP